MLLKLFITNTNGKLSKNGQYTFQKHKLVFSFIFENHSYSFLISIFSHIDYNTEFFDMCRHACVNRCAKLMGTHSFLLPVLGSNSGCDFAANDITWWTNVMARKINDLLLTNVTDFNAFSVFNFINFLKFIIHIDHSFLSVLSCYSAPPSSRLPSYHLAPSPILPCLHSERDRPAMGLNILF